MSCSRRMFPCLAFILSVSFGSQVWAQQKTAPQVVQQPTPHDFSGMVDPTAIPRLRYQGYEKAPLKFSTKAQYVLVPVVVTDKDGNPVSGLKKDDFRLEESGKSQNIASVDEIVPVAGGLSKTPLTNANEASNELAIHDKAPRRLIIVAIDMVDTPFFDQSRARQQVISYLSRTIEEDSLYQVLAIENNGIRILHDYTQSSAELIATLKKVNSHFTEIDRVDPVAFTTFGAKLEGNFSSGTPGATSVGPSLEGYTLSPQADFQAWADAKSASAEQGYAQVVAGTAAGAALNAFQQIAQRASGIPGRKSLIWITGGFPFSIDPATASLSSGIPFDVYQHVMQELGNQMIAVYPVDARGLLTTNVDASVDLRFHREENFNQSYMIADNANRQSDIIETMEVVAEMTGGHAFINTNDTAEAIRTAAKDGSRYYLLSYPLDTNNRRQGWRKITVKVGTYYVRARKGYYLTQTTVDPASAARFDVDAALTSPLAYTGVPLRVSLKPPIAAEGKNKVPFFTAIAPLGITVDNADNNHVFVDVSYVALTPQGERAFQENKSYNLNLNAEQLQQLETHGFGFDGTVAVAPGSYQLRVVVRDNLNGHVGSVLADLHAN